MNIKEKLKFLEKINQPQQEIAPSIKSEFTIDRLIDGENFPSPYGTTFVKTSIFDITQQHGSVRLDQIAEITPYHLKLAGKDENLLKLDLRNSLFFDTETTGLAGGSGTYIFLCGLGYFEEDKFVIKQFFLRDFPEEPAMLHAIREIFRRFDNVISFNGKSFDLPLLKGRFIFNRMKKEFPKPLHLDLLHASRRIWKNSLPDCSLGTIERKILQVFREGDIPSYLIPHLYFEYLHNKDARSMTRVFYHNKIDILSLVSLTIILHQVHQSPLQQLSNTTDLMTLARHYENIRQWDKNISIYEALFKIEKNPVRKKDIGIQLAFCYKRNRQWEKAERLWRDLIADGNFRIEPYEELAKYYEHRIRDLRRAAQIVRQALTSLDLLQQLRGNTVDAFLKDRLHHRLQRIERKSKPETP